MELPIIDNGMIDKDHAEIIQLAEVLEENLSPEFNNLADSIVEATTSHFQREEDLMKTIRYPYLDIHRYDHGSLQRRFTNILRMKDPIPSMVHFVKHDLVDHILEFDVPLGEFLKDKP